MKKNGCREKGDITIAAHESIHNELSAICGQLSANASYLTNVRDEIKPDLADDQQPTTNDVFSYSIEIFLSNLKSLSILPVPSTTLHSGSSAMETGKPVSSRMRLSRFLSSAPPPVSTMPRSEISAESSGGVRSRATWMAFRIVDTHSPSASRISESSMLTVVGIPSSRWRPLTSMLAGFSNG